MSLIKVRKIATLDSVAKDIQLPFVITFNNGKKEFREGYSEEDVRRRFDKGVAALYGGIKSVKLESEDKRDGKDSIATDAKFKIGDKVRRGKQTGIVRGIEKAPYIEVKFTDEPVTVFVRESEIVAADSRAADSCATDAKFQKGDKVRVWQYPVYGKMGEVVEATYGSMEYTVNVEGKDYPRIDYRRIVKVSNTAGDAAEFHVGQRVRAKDPRWAGYQGHALGNGLYTVKKVDSDGTVKLDGFLDVWISPNALVEANDSCGKGEDAEKFRVGQKVKHTRFGTVGKVFEIAPDGAIGVQWSNGQAYYGEFHRPLSEIVAVNE